MPLPSRSYLKLCQSNLTELLPSLQSVRSSLLGFNCLNLITSETLQCLYSFHNLQELECKISNSNELNLSFFPNLRKLCLISSTYKLFPQGLDTCQSLKELYLVEMKGSSPLQQITLNAPNLRRVILEYSISNLSVLKVKYELRLLRLIGNMRLKEIISSIRSSHHTKRMKGMNILKPIILTNC